MGYPNQSSLLKAIEGLNLVLDDKGDQKPLKTRGFWHVLISMRHLRLLNGNAQTREYTLNHSYDLVQACFDLNGIFLPIESMSRQVYYEPAASAGNFHIGYFRNHEGPRQTYANRIQTGLSGQGPKKPNLFEISSESLPTTVRFRDSWVEEFRAEQSHSYLLDEKCSEVLAYIFRFGIPKLEENSASICEHSDDGATRKRNSLHLQPIPDTVEEFASEVVDFFGLSQEEFSALFPRFKEIDLEYFLSPEPLTFEEVCGAITNAYPQSSDSSPTKSSSLQWSSFNAEALKADSFVGSDDLIQKSIAALKAGKHLLLLGPPGCGKSMLAKQICELSKKAGMPGYSISTATSEWTTFETIGGYMPSEENPKFLEFKPGIIAEAIMENRWLLIDEFNRADIDKAFGEMFTLLSGYKVSLNYSIDGRKVVFCPEDDEANEPHEYPIVMTKDWRMIGTMNTFDKASLFQMSYALMRRFAFIEIGVPDEVEFKQIIQGKLQDLEDRQIPGDFLAYLTNVLVKTFCKRDNNSLHSLGLQLGPAIALDVLSFLSARLDGWAPEEIKENGWRVLLEAFEMYFYPQFEGQDLHHEKIARIISDAINKPEELQADHIGSSLSIWTGYETGVR